VCGCSTSLGLGVCTALAAGVCQVLGSSAPLILTVGKAERVLAQSSVTQPNLWAPGKRGGGTSASWESPSSIRRERVWRCCLRGGLATGTGRTAANLHRRPLHWASLPPACLRAFPTCRKRDEQALIAPSETGRAGCSSETGGFNTAGVARGKAYVSGDRERSTAARISRRGCVSRRLLRRGRIPDLGQPPTRTDGGRGGRASVAGRRTGGGRTPGQKGTRRLGKVPVHTLRCDAACDCF